MATRNVTVTVTRGGVTSTQTVAAPVTFTPAAAVAASVQAPVQTKAAAKALVTAFTGGVGAAIGNRGASGWVGPLPVATVSGAVPVATVTSPNLPGGKLPVAWDMELYPDKLSNSPYF